MKRGFILLALVIVAGVAAFCFTRSHKMAEQRALRLDSMPELAWVRTDLKLTDEQFEKVSELHAAYRPKCMEMCRRISKAHEKVQAAARAGGAMTPELETAIREHAETQVECQRAMLKHIYETAAVLDKDRAARYLETMLPFALDFTRDESGTSPSR
jgi:hypothetical protein